ncbi:hypothetical protein UFOVP1670_57 [uncultured Caudovirales phage]|uniref:Uncharacterized protein n=1 Tax=uncultured Caudovirales phage TaxID=2100421 RepID=A0A6J5T744_9CAUD|nr:hypothetical protein UFOVP1670_57 [uncultured Caudovirales phage]
MTHILKGGATENAKWRIQANRIAKELKRQKLPEKSIKVGVAFDDAFVRITMTPEFIRDRTEKQLADHIHDQILTHAQTGGTA